MTTIKELRELEKKAPKAPWYAGSYTGTDVNGEYTITRFCEHPRPDGINTDPNGYGGTIISSGSGEYAADSAGLRLAVAARNALPLLLDIAEKASEAVEAGAVDEIYMTLLRDALARLAEVK